MPNGIHTKEFDKLVTKVKAELKEYHKKGNAYAIAEHALGYKKSIRKEHRRK